MSHLTLETLARLLDEAPTAVERAHLAACEACRSELEALRGQTEHLGALPRMIPPPDQWPELRTRLLEERVIRGAPSRRLGSAVRAAAAVFLFLGGGAVGWAARGVPAGAADAARPALASEQPAEGAAGQRLAGTGPAGRTAGDAGAATDTDAAAGAADATDAGSQTTAEPGLEQVEEAEERFLAALDRYMAATTTSPSDPAARLATLDNIVLTTAEALNEAPADPVINSFHLTALAQRNAMLRQIQTASDPVF